MRTIAVANHKGGVGKTTTAVNLSACLVEKGFRVLLVDLDPQGNATSHVGYNPYSFEQMIYDALMDMDDRIDIADIIVERSETFHLLPANLEMSEAEIRLNGLVEREYRLKSILDKVRKNYDYAVVDCPPSLGVLTLNAFYAADDVIITIQTQPFALSAVNMVRANLIRIYNSRQRRGEPIFRVWALPTIHDKRTNQAKDILNEINEEYGALVLPPIHINIKLSESCSLGQHILEYDPLSSGATDFRRMTKEFLNAGEEEKARKKTAN